MQDTEPGGEQEEFLDLCNKVKEMTDEQKNRKRKHEEDGGGRPGPTMGLQYGPIDWRPKEKLGEKPAAAQPETRHFYKPEAAPEPEGAGEMLGEAPKKKGKIKRRGKKKGKRNKPDKDEGDKQGDDNSMDC